MMKVSSVCFVTACLLSERASAAADNAPVRPADPYTITFVGASNNAPGNRDLPGFYQDITRDTPTVSFPLDRIYEDGFEYRGNGAIRTIQCSADRAGHQLSVSLMVFPRQGRGYGWTWRYVADLPEKLDGSLAGEYTMTLSDQNDRQRADCAPDTLLAIIAPNRN